MELLTDPNAWIALLTLALLEIVLGIDNIIFLSILVGRLPEQQRARARFLGLAMALGMRILLLLSIAWIVGLVHPLFTVAGREVAGRDIIPVAGGLFLLWKSVHEIHNSLEGEEGQGEGDQGGGSAARGADAFFGVLVQIALIDLVFSLDSVITAVGMVDDVRIMIAAVLVSVGVMMVAAGPIGAFVDKHPSIKMLALSFLVLVGTVLIAEGFNTHIPKGYVYFAMAFSMAVEMLNLRARAKSAAVRLRKQGPH